MPLDAIYDWFDVLVGLATQVKPPLLVVNGHLAVGPTACQLMGSVVELVDQVVDVVLGAMLSYVLVVA